MARPFTYFVPETPGSLILSSPHSGRRYPEDFRFTCPLPLLRQAEDAYVDELIAHAPEAGITVIAAEFPRSYIDLNRAEDDIDPAVLDEPWPGPLKPSEHTLQGLGLVRRLCRSGQPIYERPLLVADVQERIGRYYRPYHEALENALAERAAAFGAAYLIDCHSMPALPKGGRAGEGPDFVLGDKDGTSCDPAFTRLVQDALQELGYSVALNNPYKGVEILRRYGCPALERHALQLEISRRLYMNEHTLEKTPGFSRLRENLGYLFEKLAKNLPKASLYGAAAE